MVGQILRIDSLKDPAKNMAAATEYYLAYCRSRNLSENSIIYYRNRLASFATYVADNAPGIGPKETSVQIVREFISWELERVSPATVNHSIIALRAFFNLLENDGLIERNPLAGIKKVHQKRPLIETFSQAQVEALLAACGSNFAGVRDRAMMLLLYDSGARASELCGLRLEDVDWQECTFRVTGKGDKERLVGFGEVTRRAVQMYSARRPDLDTTALFVTCYGMPIGRHRLARIIKGRCERAGITGLRCSPHTFRHTFAISYLRSGGDLFTAAEDTWAQRSYYDQALLSGIQHRYRGAAPDVFTRRSTSIV